MIRKTIALSLALLAVASVFIGCEKKEAPPKETPEKTAPAE